jgi:Ser/Thr protein kinase RdoA (MazF antagonist)
VLTAALLDDDPHTRALTFTALPGEPLGSKYPADLAPADIDTILGLGRALVPYDPRRRWFRRLRTARRLAVAVRSGLLEPAAAAALATIAESHHRRLRFAHGDLTARNVLRAGDDIALIDWEWAGLYPPGYDEAFLWFSLHDVEGGRAHVERNVTTSEPSFLLSALLIELLHLQWYIPSEFRARHLATRDALLRRLLR